MNWLLSTDAFAWNKEQKGQTNEERKEKSLLIILREKQDENKSLMSAREVKMDVVNGGGVESLRLHRLFSDGEEERRNGD